MFVRRRGRGTGKYGAQMTAGFHSLKEKRRHDDLMLMQKGGVVRNLRRQVRYVLCTVRDGEAVPIKYHGSNRSLRYFADFVYEEKTGDNWTEVVEDVKGFDTRESKIKRAILQSQLGISIRVT